MALQVRRLSGEERYAPYIQLRKIKDHFIFTIESTGAWRPHELFNYAVQVCAQGGPFVRVVLLHTHHKAVESRRVACHAPAHPSCCR